MSDSRAGHDQALQRAVFIRGADRPFGELTLEDARTRASELRSVAGWGPTVRVAPVAHAWRELAMAMERSGCERVCDLDPEVVDGLAQRLWVVLPGGSLMS
jgi:hypothetical protein